MTGRKGFTLIELLIVVVIIGTWLPSRFRSSRTRRRRQSWLMKSDLRNLVTAQEAFFADNKSTRATARDPDRRWAGRCLRSLRSATRPATWRPRSAGWIAAG